ncbi:MAG: serine hydrolase domain-containing protein [Acidobacteriota bacterium]
MKKPAIALVIAFSLLNTSGIRAQKEGPRDQNEFVKSYDAYIKNTMEKVPDIPGFAVVVIKDDKPIFVKAYGMADKEAGVRSDVDTLYYIASSTKSFTALAAALLDREGKIKLDDPVSKYSNGVAFKTRLPEKITVRDLLTHTSGLRNGPLVFRMAYSGESDAADMKRVFGSATTFTEERYGKYNYDNLGYNIYAVLLQNHLGLKWQDVLQSKVFDPIGLKHTTAYVSKAKRKKYKIAAPYMYDPASGKEIRAPLEKVDNNMQSAGGMFASVSDIGRWLNLNMNDGMLDGKQVIPAEVMRAVHTGFTATTRDAPPFSGEGQYGLGWQIGKYRNEKVIYHHGGFPGYRSHISYLPEKKIAIAVLVNDGFAGSRAADMFATFGYDWWLGLDGFQAAYDKELQNLADRYAQAVEQMRADVATRAKRTSQLTKPLGDYAGKYVNDDLGAIIVSNTGTDLMVKMGNIKVTATNFTQRETIRVEMVPGSGEVIKFNKTADGKVDSLTYAGATFTRIS